MTARRVEPSRGKLFPRRPRPGFSIAHAAHYSGLRVWMVDVLAAPFMSFHHKFMPNLPPNETP